MPRQRGRDERGRETTQDEKWYVSIECAAIDATWIIVRANMQPHAYMLCVPSLSIFLQRAVKVWIDQFVHDNSRVFMRNVVTSSRKCDLIFIHK